MEPYSMLGLLNMGGAEIMLVLAIVLVLFGGKKLPELAKGLGNGIREFKKASSGAAEEMRHAIEAPASKRLLPAAADIEPAESPVSNA